MPHAPSAHYPKTRNRVRGLRHTPYLCGKRPSESSDLFFRRPVSPSHPYRTRRRVCRPEATHAFYAACPIRALPKNPKPRAWLTPHTLPMHRGRLKIPPCRTNVGCVAPRRRTRSMPFKGRLKKRFIGFQTAFAQTLRLTLPNRRSGTPGCRRRAASAGSSAARRCRPCRWGFGTAL